MYNLGLMYCYGRGVEKDYPRGSMLFEQARYGALLCFVRAKGFARHTSAVVVWVITALMAPPLFRRACSVLIVEREDQRGILRSPE